MCERCKNVKVKYIITLLLKKYQGKTELYDIY